MKHVIPITVEIIGSLLLIGGYVTYRRGPAQAWANRSLFCLAVGGLTFGLMGMLLNWHHFGITERTLGIIALARPSFGGISIGLFISLLLSGQLWKIGRVPRKTKDDPNNTPEDIRRPADGSPKSSV
jgi:hypothetical protein